MSAAYSVEKGDYNGEKKEIVLPYSLFIVNENVSFDNLRWNILNEANRVDNTISNKPFPFVYNNGVRDVYVYDYNNNTKTITITSHYLTEKETYPIQVYPI